MRRLSEPPPATTGARVDIDMLLSMPPPPPPERPLYDPELDFDDSPTLRAARGAAKAKAVEASSEVPSIQPVALTEAAEAPKPKESSSAERRRPSVLGAALAFGSVVALSAGLAIGLRPANPPKEGLREELRPAAAVLQALTPAASELTPASTAAPSKNDVKNDVAPGDPIALPGVPASPNIGVGAGTWRGPILAKGAPSASPKATAEATSEPADPPAPEVAAAAFDPAAARAALAGRAGAASACFDESATQVAHVTITFQPSGRSTQAVVSGSYAGTSIGSCIAGAFRGASVAPFEGAAVTVSTSVRAPVKKTASAE